MIRINLLPPEKRRLERTPLPVFILMVLAIVIFGGGAAYTYMSLAKKQELENEEASLLKRKADLERTAQEVTALKGALAKLGQEVVELSSVIPLQELNTTTIIGQLVAVLSEHSVWIDEVKIYFDPADIQTSYKRVETSAVKFPTIAIEVKCNTPSAKTQLATLVRRALENDEFFRKYFPEINKYPKLKVNSEIEYEEEKSLSFEIQLFTQIK